MIIVLSKMKIPFQFSKVVNTRFLIHVSYTVEVRKYHTNCSLTLSDVTILYVEVPVFPCIITI